MLDCAGRASLRAATALSGVERLPPKRCRHPSPFRLWMTDAPLATASPNPPNARDTHHSVGCHQSADPSRSSVFCLVPRLSIPAGWQNVAGGRASPAPPDPMDSILHPGGMPDWSPGASSHRLPFHSICLPFREETIAGDDPGVSLRSTPGYCLPCLRHPGIIQVQTSNINNPQTGPVFAPALGRGSGNLKPQNVVISASHPVALERGRNRPDIRTA